MKYTIRNCSMCPCLREGMEIKLRVQSIRLVRIGEIVAYYDRQSGKLILHRVISKKGGFLYTKGDNNWFMDEQAINTHNVLIVYRIVNNKRTIDAGDIRFELMNKVYWLLSVVRFFPLIYRRPLLKKYMVNGVRVTRKKYRTLVKNR